MTETGQDFAARFWGCEGLVPTPVERAYGRRGEDGGRPEYPAGWRFEADSSRYHVYVDDRAVWHLVCLSDDSFAMFRRDGDHWAVDHGWLRRVTHERAADH